MSDVWYVYVLECADETLYTGITTDPQRRIREHNESSKGARYTRSRRPVEPVAVWTAPDQSQASKDEAAFKALTRNEKLRRVRLSQPLEEFREVVARYLQATDRPDVDVEDVRPLRLAEDAPPKFRRIYRVKEAVESADQPIETTFVEEPSRGKGEAVFLEEPTRLVVDTRCLDGEWDGIDLEALVER